jgi:hypothetical protein
MHGLGDRVDRHEADIVPLHRILRAGIAEADPDLHGRYARVPPVPTATLISLSLASGLVARLRLGLGSSAASRRLRRARRSALA